jgi:predicted NACHT family NTPase
LRELQETNQLDQLEELESYRQTYINVPVCSVLEVVEDTACQYLVILGDPGSGKSTLTQYLLLNWAEQKSRKIPLLIELRKYVKDRNLPKDFLEFFHQGSDVICRLNRHQLHQELAAGNALVMFDGLDEVFDPALRDAIITEIIRFTNEYKKVIVIVTSRIIGYKSQRLRDAHFKHFTLQDLELEQITDFINKWHNLAFGNHPDKLRLQARLIEAINYSPAIRELAGNPLLLTMMAILNRNQELPRDRAELYEQASRVLLQEWDVGKNLPIPVDTIGRQEKQAMLRKVAYFMQSAPEGLTGNLIKVDDLENILRNYLKNIEINSPYQIAKLIIKQLRERNFILCFLGADTYGFVHRTFLEYFCAWEFVWQFEKEKIIDIEFLINEVFGKNWKNESWHELLKLIAAMIEPKFVGEIINYLIQQSGEQYEFINLFLAADCLLEVRNWQDLKDISEILLEHLTKLTEYGDLSEILIRDTLIRIRSLTIEKIAKTWRDKDTTLPWLKSFIEQEFSQEYAFVPYAAVKAIAQNWQYELDTLSLIKKCSRYALNKYVRQSAALELGRLWRDDPETFTILVDVLKNDATPDVRWTVVRVISQYFSHHPQTKSLLQESCFDENFNVRFNAIKSIGNWYQESEIIDLLYRCAKNDPFVRTNPLEDNPRKTALEAIIKYYPENPYTWELLQDRATNDPDEQVREFTKEQLNHDRT